MEARRGVLLALFRGYLPGHLEGRVVAWEEGTHPPPALPGRDLPGHEGWVDASIPTHHRHFPGGICQDAVGGQDRAGAAGYRLIRDSLVSHFVINMFQSTRQCHMTQGSLRHYADTI